MALRQTSGSVICPSCGVLVGVNDDACYQCGRRNPGLFGFAPVLRRLGRDLGFVPLVIGASLALYTFMLLASGSNIRMGGLFSMFSPDNRVLFLFGASGSLPVFGLGRWWTVLSAGWLHAGVLHIFFNMLWVRQLAPATAERYGPARMVIIYVLAGVCGFALSSFAGAFVPPILVLRGGQFTVGASAPIFGLLGALVCYGRRTGSSMAAQEALQYALFLGLFGLMPGSGVDNYAHAGGFAGGYMVARLLDPLKHERGDHMILALGCLAATAVAILYSIASGISLLG